MKQIFLALLLLLNVAPSSAQEVVNIKAERHSSQRWCWFHTENWARDMMLSEPGWRLQNHDKNAAGWDYVLFSSLDYSQAVAFRLLRGSIGGVTFLFNTEHPSANEWITTQFERVSNNEWIDKPSNARVKRRYNGNMVEYRIDYEPFTDD